MNRTDHDLLIAMNTKLDIVLTRQEDQERRLREVEGRPAGDPVVHARVDDHENRLRWVEGRVIGFSAAAAALGAGGGWGITSLLGH